MDEWARKRLHDALERALGGEEAAILMRHLPPMGWGDVATKRDLDQGLLSLRDQMRAEMERGFRRTIQWNVGTVIAMSGIVLAITRLG